MRRPGTGFTTIGKQGSTEAMQTTPSKRTHASRIAWAIAALLVVLWTTGALLAHGFADDADGSTDQAVVVEAAQQEQPQDATDQWESQEQPGAGGLVEEPVVEALPDDAASASDPAPVQEVPGDAADAVATPEFGDPVGEGVSEDELASTDAEPWPASEPVNEQAAPAQAPATSPEAAPADAQAAPDPVPSVPLALEMRIERVDQSDLVWNIVTEDPALPQTIAPVVRAFNDRETNETYAAWLRNLTEREQDPQEAVQAFVVHDGTATDPDSELPLQLDAPIQVRLHSSDWTGWQDLDDEAFAELQVQYVIYLPDEDGALWPAAYTIDREKDQLVFWANRLSVIVLAQPMPQEDAEGEDGDEASADDAPDAQNPESVEDGEGTVTADDSAGMDGQAEGDPDSADAAAGDRAAEDGDEAPVYVITELLDGEVVVTVLDEDPSSSTDDAATSASQDGDESASAEESDPDALDDDDPDAADSSNPLDAIEDLPAPDPLRSVMSAAAPGRRLAAVDDSIIKNYSTAVFYGGTVDSEGRYVWNAKSSTADHRFSYRISFDLDVPPEGLQENAVTIKIPRTILKTRTNEQGDYYEMSIPSRDDVVEAQATGEQLDRDMQFAFYEDGDYIVIYNFRPITSATTGYIEMSYITSETTFSYVDMQESAPFNTSIAVVGPDGATHTHAEDGLPVYINTQATIGSTEKRIPTKYDTWQSSWGEKPEDADDYCYFLWEIRSNINEPSQPYSFTLTDELVKLVGKGDGSEQANAEVYGYRFAGQKTFTKNNTIENQTMRGMRYDFVLTRFKNSYWGSLDHWEITNQITSTVTPLDGVPSSSGGSVGSGDQPNSATSTRSFYWNRPVFTGVGGGIGVHKRADGWYRMQSQEDAWPREWLTGLGNSAANYSRYDLDELRDGHVEYLGNLDYAAFLQIYGYKWTLEPGASSKDYTKYGVQPVVYQLTDNEFILFDETGGVANGVPLTSSADYQIDTIAYAASFYDARFDESDQEFKRKAATIQDGEQLQFFAQFGSTDSEWKPIATYDLKTKTFTYDETYVASMTGRLITLNDGCVGYRVQTTNTHYYTEIDTVPNARIKNSPTVMGFTSTETGIGLNNRQRTLVYTTTTGEDGAPVWSEKPAGSYSAADADYIRNAERTSSIEKNVVATTNIAKRKQYVLTWKIDMSEWLIEGQDEHTPVEQAGGTFYDLLPDGANPDVNSVLIETDDGYLDANAYTVEVRQNYKDSGRTLLVVHVLDPADRYTVYFDTVHSYEAIKDYGNDVYNPVAYQTGNLDIVDGYPDNGGIGQDKDGNTTYVFTDKLAPENIIDLMAGLDPDSTGNRFIYAERTYDIASITAASIGLSKKVKAEADRDYAYDTTTTNNSIYSYRLRVQNSFANETKDLVVYDALEEFSANRRASDWRGTLVEVDLSQLVERGIDPKAYVSTRAGLDLSTASARDLTDASVWTLVEDPSSESGKAVLKTARAVAIDMSRAINPDENGSYDFVLEKGASISAFLYMQSPAGAERLDGSEGYPEAYNNLYAVSTMLDDYRTPVGAPAVTHNDFTTTRLVITGDVTVHKVSEQDPNVTIRNIQFRLVGTSDYGTAYDQILSTDRNGTLTFADVEKGTYVLSEYAATPDWQEDHTEHEVLINDAGQVLVDGQDCTDVGVTIENKPRVHGDLELKKRRQITETDDSVVPIPNTVFQLSGTSDYGNDITMVATSDSAGSVLFADVEEGTYTLRELQANDEYLLSETEYRVDVDETGAITVSAPTGDLDEQGDPVYELVDYDGLFAVIYNTPRFWDLTLRKVDKDNITRWLEGATLRLEGENISVDVLDEDGNVTGTVNYLEVTSDRNGKVTFEHLEAGSYVLTETAAPTGVDANGHKVAAANDAGEDSDSGDPSEDETQEGEGSGEPTGEDADDGDGAGADDAQEPVAAGNLNYVRDESSYIVNVAEDGTITIEGLEKNMFGEYMFKNERALDGEIVVIKKWEDDGIGRPVAPTVHLTVIDDESVAIRGVTVTKQWVGDYADARPSAVGINLLRAPVIKDDDGNVTGVGAMETFDAGEPTWTKTADIWTCTFPDVVVDGTYVYYAYETESGDAEKYAKYTSTAGSADKAVQLQSGKATITNMYHGDVYDFGYTGDVQEWTAPTSGYYQFEAWGAQGGNSYGNNKPWYSYGGHGAYTSGAIYLEAGQTMYVYVGGRNNGGVSATAPNGYNVPASFNGGGAGNYDNQREGNGAEVGGSGGGATDFRLVKGTNGWDDFDSLKSRIMVAAGGGGGADSSSDTSPYAGAGGALSAPNVNISGYTVAVGATQTTGYAFGIGENATFRWYNKDGGGGGGGYFGGFTCNNSRFGNNYYRTVGAGGSSFVSGYEGCNAVSESSIASNITFLNSSTHYSGKAFTNPVMKSGLERITEPGGASSTGHVGNGYARITFVSATQAQRPTQPTVNPDAPVVPTYEYTSVDEDWQKVDDDTQKYVFHVFNDNATFVVTEDAIEGYTTSPSGTVTIDGSQTKQVTFTNTRAAAYGSLTVAKQVQNLASSTQKFDIIVTLSGSKVPSGQQIIGGVVFTDGVAHLSLASGESRTISGIPVGTSYAVTETPNANFSATVEGGSGSIVAEEEAQATVTNVYTPPPGPNPVNVTLAKALVDPAGQGDDGTDYTFWVSMTGLASDLEYTYVKQGAGIEGDADDQTDPSQDSGEGDAAQPSGQQASFVSSASGSATFSVTLKADQSITFMSLPVGATYQFTEVGGDYIASYRVENGSTSGSVAQTAAANTGKDADLTTGVETVDDGEAATVTFTNELRDYQNIKVVKAVETTVPVSIHSGASYEFTVYFSGMEDGAWFNSNVGRVLADGNGDAQKTFQLKDGESVDFLQVPAGVQYRVEEAKSREAASYAIVDANGGDAIVQASDANQGIGALSTQVETVNRGEDVTVTFTNRQILAPLSLEKQVTGNMGSRDKEFDFSVGLSTELAGQRVWVDVVDTLNQDAPVAQKSREYAVGSDGTISLALSHGERATIAGVRLSDGAADGSDDGESTGEDDGAGTSVATYSQGLPIDLTYTIAESDYAAAGYRAMHAVDGGSQVLGSMVDGTVAPLAYSEGGEPLPTNAVVFTNANIVGVPTGVTPIAGVALFASSIGLGGATVLTAKRRRD